MDESHYRFKATYAVFYKGRNFICFIFVLYLILQGGMVMLYMDTNTALTVTTMLIPSYVVVYGLLVLFPLLLRLSGLRVFTCDNVSAWLVILAMALFVSLGIAYLQHPDLGYFVTFMPPVALLIFMALIYIIRIAVELPKTVSDVETIVESTATHDLD